MPGGPETGRALTANPEIDKFTFTGSSAVGKEIGKIAAEKLKPCSLELGGKSAAIILEDADLDSTLPMLAFSGFMNSGQACVAQTRILAPRSRYDEVVEKVSAAAAAMPIGLPDDPGAMIGPLISARSSASASRATSRRASRKVRGWSPAAAGPRAWTADGSFSQRFSPMSTTR